jgi:N-acetylglucosaminyldiphosphoundecaprenol N-acetyl-beta-D-mannosaminyltransferase
MKESREILGYPISLLDITQISEILNDSARDRLLGLEKKSNILHFLNAFCLTEATRDTGLEDCYKSINSINLVDGFSLSIVGRIFGNEHIRRIRGSDFTRKVLSGQRESKLRLGLIGGSKYTIGELQKNLELRFEGLEFEMVYSPPFADVRSFPILEIANELEMKKIDLCLIAIGTPKQDQLAKLLGNLCSSDFACIGAAIDFVSGMKKECPRWLSKIGLEWLFRLISEPKRLWKRYTIGIVQFLELVVSFHISKNLKRK